MKCEGAAVVLAEVTLLLDRSSYAKQMAMLLYRCAAADGDIEAQLKLASLLADEGATEMEVEPNVEEASSWYLRACASEEATASQLAQAHLEVGHLFMNRAKYDRAAHHFSLASDTYHEAAELQRVCEEQVEKHWRWQQHHS